MILPPRWLRRLLLGPLVVLVTLAMIGVLPVWLILAVFASRFLPGRRRPLRLLWFLLVWLAFETAVLIGLFGLWVASGFGWKIKSDWFQGAHYILMGWFLGSVVGTAKRTFGLIFDVEWTGADDLPGRPLLVFARHAGPGDSLLLVDAVANYLHRRPRIVLKDLLQWDPAIDTLLHRVPSRFVAGGKRQGLGTIEAISEMASTMGPEDALVIFPEGGNFTPDRRLRAIEKLEAAGLDDFAERARELEFLLPPKPGGVIAAINGAPTATVGLVAHVGLDHMLTPGDIWTGLVMDNTIHTRVWFIEAEALPAGRDGLEDWLYDRWEEMDGWITSHRRPKSPSG